MDRGYLDFERLFAFTASGAFFVVRTRAEVNQELSVKQPRIDS